MKICLAQTRPIKADIVANTETHVRLIRSAAQTGADAIFFPELSLSSYEPELAKELAIKANHPQLNIFNELSNTLNLTLSIGIPLSVSKGIHIAMAIFQPGKSPLTYSKQFLHQNELPYFQAGNQQVIIHVGDAKIAPAICYESLETEHSDQTVQMGANLYLASVAKSQQGLEKAFPHYLNLAARHNMPVLMCNAVGFCDNFMSAGQSSIWSKTGQHIACLGNEEEGFLIFDTHTEKVGKQLL